MSEPAHVLVVAHQTAATAPLLDAVRERAARGPARFHLVVPRQPHGLDKVVDPADHGQGEARRAMAEALPKLSAAAGQEVTGERRRRRAADGDPGRARPAAITTRSSSRRCRSGVSRWLQLDLVSKARALGLPVTHVLAESHEEAPAEV